MLEAVGDVPAIVVCNTCRFDRTERDSPDGQRGGAMFFDVLKSEAQMSLGSSPYSIQEMSCLFACSRHCVIHIRAPGKIAYVLGDFEPVQQAAEAIIDFFGHYIDSDDGIVPYKYWHDGVKGHFIVRVAPDGFIAT